MSDLPEAFRRRSTPHQCVGWDADACPPCDRDQGYNHALRATKAADLWRENRRLRALLRRGLAFDADAGNSLAEWRRDARSALRDTGGDP